MTLAVSPAVADPATRAGVAQRRRSVVGCRCRRLIVATSPTVSSRMFFPHGLDVSPEARSEVDTTRALMRWSRSLRCHRAGARTVRAPGAASGGEARPGGGRAESPGVARSRCGRRPGRRTSGVRRPAECVGTTSPHTTGDVRRADACDLAHQGKHVDRARPHHERRGRRSPPGRSRRARHLVGGAWVLLPSGACRASREASPPIARLHQAAAATPRRRADALASCPPDRPPRGARSVVW